MKRLLFITSIIVTVGAVLLGVILVIFTSTSAQIAVIVSFTPLIITLGFAAYSAIRTQLEDVDNRRFGSLPVQQLVSLPELEPAVVGIVAEAAKIRDHHGPFMLSLAAEYAQQASNSIGEIADGSAICHSSEELRLVRIALQHTKRRVRAVAARGAQWWERPEAAAYWHAYEAAANRLDITRIFLVRPDEDRALLDRVLARQKRAGMKTFVLDAGKVPDDHIRPLVIFDEGLIHRNAKSDSSDGTFTRVEFCDRPEELLAAEETFRVVFDLAKEANGEGPEQQTRWRRLGGHLRRRRGVT